MEKELELIIEMMEGIINDPSVPKNIRKTMTEAKEKLMSNEELKVKVSSAIYMIESISEDINIPPHARTQIWSIMSELERVQ